MTPPPGHHTPCDATPQDASPHGAGPQQRHAPMMPCLKMPRPMTALSALPRPLTPDTLRMVLLCKGSGGPLPCTWRHPDCNWDSPLLLQSWGTPTEVLPLLHPTRQEWPGWSLSLPGGGGERLQVHSCDIGWGLDRAGRGSPASHRWSHHRRALNHGP